MLHYNGFTPVAWAIFALGIASSPTMAGVETNKLEVLISANETRGEGGSNWTYAWSFDGQWAAQGKHSMLQLTVDSDYSRSETATTDHLQNSLRWIGASDAADKGWKPVLLTQTEGDHSFDDALLLLAAGMRRNYRYGFLEFTAGASREIGVADDWAGDVGLAFAYARQFGDRLKVSSGPTAQYGMLGELRRRNDRLRYSWNMNIDYLIYEKCSLGYRLWMGNTTANTERTQWVGLNFKIK